MIFSTPVSLSVHDTDKIDCLRLIGFGPPLPCKFVYKQSKLHDQIIRSLFKDKSSPELALWVSACLPFVTERLFRVHQTPPPSDIALFPSYALLSEVAEWVALALALLAVDTEHQGL